MTWENIKNNLKPNASIWILFVAAILIIVFFLYYFFFYIKGNEEFLIQKNLRVLTQISENFNDRYNGYLSVINSSDMQTGISEKDPLFNCFSINWILIGRKMRDIIG